MDLDKFLKHKSFSKYKNGIEEIREEFIDEGCEKFLWTNNYTDMAIR